VALVGGRVTLREVAWGLVLAAAFIGVLSALPSGEYVPRWHTPEGGVVTLDSVRIVAVPPDADGTVLAVGVGWLGGVPYWCAGDGWVEVDPDEPCVLPGGRELRGYCDMELTSRDYTIAYGVPPLCE
jgi:hypothetical protein